MRENGLRNELVEVSKALDCENRAASSLDLDDVDEASGTTGPDSSMNLSQTNECRER